MKNVIIVTDRDNMYYGGIDEWEYRKYTCDPNKAFVFQSKEEAQKEATRLNEISSYTYEATTI